LLQFHYRQILTSLGVVAAHKFQIRQTNLSIQGHFNAHPNLSLVLAGDGAWAKRGWTSSQGVYVAIDTETKKVVKVIVLQHERTYTKNGELNIRRKGNYGGTSGGMEIEGLRQVLEWLKLHKLLHRVTHWVTDKDSTVTEELHSREDTKHITIIYDPGHIKKSFQGQLILLFGKGQQYVDFPARISSFFMKLIKRSEAEHPKDISGMKAAFLGYWSHTLGMVIAISFFGAFFGAIHICIQH